MTQVNERPITLRELTVDELDNVGGGTLAGPLQPVVDATANAAVDVTNGVVAGGNGIINAIDANFH